MFLANMSKRFKRFIYLLTVFAFAACNQKKTGKLNRIEANVSDVAVLTNKDLTSGLTEIFNNSFDTFNLQKHLPHTNGRWGFETIFNYIMLSEEEESLAQNNRLVLLVNSESDLNDDLDVNPIDKGELKFQNEILGSYMIYEDVWGKGQQVIQIELDDDAQNTLANFNKKNNLTSMKLIKISQTIQNLINHCHEKLNLKGSLGYCEPNDIEYKYSDSVMRLLKKNYGFSIFIPSSFRIVQADSNFVWLTKIKSEGGYEAIMLNINHQPIETNNIESVIENRNWFTSKYLHNDEGTKIAVSESGSYRPFMGKSGITNKIPYQVMFGWYTEMGTYRRGPFGRYLFHNGQKQVAVDWFAGGSERYNAIKSHLDLVAKSFKFEE